MVTELCSYPFSSYPAFIGQVKAPKWLELNWLLSLFGQSRRSAAKNYRDFVEKVDIASVENPAKDISGGFILGGVEFVNWVKESFLSNRREKRKFHSFGNFFRTDFPYITALGYALAAFMVNEYGNSDYHPEASYEPLDSGVGI